MHDPCDHDHGTPPAGSLGSLGIPRPGAFDGPAFERAVADLLRACGIAADGAHTGRTPRRVRELWERRLLGGYALDPAEVLGTGFADPRQDMVVVRGIAVHGAGSVPNHPASHADALVGHGQARGAACVIEAEQLCLLLGEDRRGDERVVTQAFAGCFEGDAQLRAEFMRAIGGGRV